MSTLPYSLKNDYIAGMPPSAADLNRRANIVSAQLAGALEGHGEGVLALPDDTSLEVSYDGGSVYVDEGAAYVRNENGHLIYVVNPAQMEVEEYTPGIVNYIFAVSYLSPNPLIPDSETARLCRLVADDTDSFPGALLLAEVSATGVVTDRREWISNAALLQRITQLESDLGYSNEQRTKGTVAARLDALSSDDGGGATVTFLSQLKYSVEDPRNAVTVIEEKLALLAATNSDTQAVRENPELRALIAELGSQGLGLAEVNAESTLRSTATTVLIGITGDGSGGSIDDLVEGTANVDEELQVIGP